MPGDVGSFEPWPAGQSTLWARTTFTVGAEDLDDVMFWGRWDDEITVYVNGVLAVERDEWTPSNRYLGLSEAARATLTAMSGGALAGVHPPHGAAAFLASLNIRAENMTEQPSPK